MMKERCLQQSESCSMHSSCTGDKMARKATQETPKVYFFLTEDYKIFYISPKRKLMRKSHAPSQL